MDKSPYNSTVSGKIMITPDLMVLRIRTDEPRKEFKAGQYTSIGVLSSEQRSPNSVVSLNTVHNDELIIRPYSIASADHETQNFEFYISQVKSGELTPRLFNLSLGNRMWIDKKILGIFSLNDTPNNCDIVMIATGTGLASSISFLRSHLRKHKDNKLVVFHGAEMNGYIGYRSELEFIQYSFDNFYYFPTLLKADDSWSGLKGYIQTHLDSNLLKNIGVAVTPSKTHFFLCGNPCSLVESVCEILEAKNYTINTKKNPGSLHIEQY